MDSRRIIPLTCEDQYRLAAEFFGKILPNELHTTSNHKRGFIQGFVIAPVHHGNIENEAAMLALNVDSPNTVIVGEAPNGRGCFAHDTCYRLDTDSLWICLTNRGESIVDWFDFGQSGLSEVSDTIDGLNAANELCLSWGRNQAFYGNIMCQALSMR